MTNSYYTKIGLTGRIQNTPNHIQMPQMLDLEALDSTQKETFKDTINNIAHSLNNDMGKPEQMMTSVLSGSNDVDIHDVMTAIAKAEMSISVVTQLTSKVIQAYDKITQISV